MLVGISDGGQAGVHRERDEAPGSLRGTYRMIDSYVELVRHRLENRSANIMANLEKLGEGHLRFTMRIFGDCLDEEARGKLLAGYTEYWTEKELRREVDRMGMLFRPYMLSDPGFNEGVLEFALYFDLLDRLTVVPPADLLTAARELAPPGGSAVAGKTIQESDI